MKGYAKAHSTVGAARPRLLAPSAGVRVKHEHHFARATHVHPPRSVSRAHGSLDDTRGAAFDPTSGNRTPSAQGIARARKLLSERFPELARAPLVSAEVCQYENSPDGNLIIDRHPHAKNVWLAGGGSGHGFKLSPAVGEMTAAAVISGKDVPKQFRLDRLHDREKRHTQFDAKTKS